MADQAKLTLTPPQPFEFERTAYSHGWVVLSPNSWDEEALTMRRVHALGGGKVVLLDISGAGEKVAVKVQSKKALDSGEKREIKAAVSRMLRLDEDLSVFYARCKKEGQPWTRLTQGLGRLLRSPSVFEDLVKTICTTNIQWGGTKRMVANLVEALGQPYPGNPALKSFPTPEAMAKKKPEYFTETVRMGYRGPYVSEIARQVVAGKLDLEGWLTSDLPTPDLKKELLAVKGVGNYAAATMLMLLGRYDELAVDTVFRDFVSKKYFGGDRPADAEMAAVYEKWGEWKYLAYWFDIWMDLDETL
jgi:3-methyladenine DNA glycosylase/8-oxoguanine DNA glycosylase